MDDNISLDAGEGLALESSDLVLDGDGLTLEGTGVPPAKPLKDVDIEAEALEEVNEVLSGFKARAKREDQRFQDATDSEYWVALCFQTREQKEEFLEKVGWLDLGDKYLDGMACAEVLDIKLESLVPPLPTLRLDAKLVSMAQKLTRS